MNAKNRLFRSAAAIALSITLAAAFRFCSRASAEDKLGAEEKQQAERLIDDMASRNTAPKIAFTEFNDEVPLFADDYDWPEQERVWRAMKSVMKTKSDEMWRRLVKHADDGRYALTCDNDEFVDMTAENFSVGKLCSHIARSDLGRPYLKHLQTEEWRILPEDRFDPQSEFWKHQEKWEGKPLYLIQIEVCKRAIEQMASATGVRSAYGGESPARTFSAKEKAAFSEAVKKEIQELERAQRADTSSDLRLPGFGNRKFDPKRAEEARKLYEMHGKKS